MGWRRWQGPIQSRNGGDPETELLGVVAEKRG